MSHNILIITHFFPPTPGVGGRRWTKFVKYLSKKEDVKINVVSAINTNKDVESSFVNEVNNLNFKHTQVASNYPKYLHMLDFSNPSLYGKIMFRVQLLLLKLRVKGNYWDFSVLWKEHFEKIIPDIIRKEKIDIVIISGTPFRYTYFATELKNKFKDVQLILDYRDPWNDFNDPYPISEKRNAFERNLEKETLKKFDKIITVSDFQKKLINKTQDNSTPVYVVPNGFDHEDYDFNLKEKKQSDKIKIVHFGTLHFLKDYYWIPFFKAFSRLKKNNEAIYNRIEIHLVGYCPHQIKDFIIEQNIDVNIHGMLDPFDAYNELNQADIALWFKYDGSPGDFATKFGDYIATKKYMWTFSVKGAVTKHIEEHEIGKVFYRDEINLEEKIYQSFLDVENKDSNVFNPKYDPSQLQISSLTNKLLEVINK